MSSSVKKDIYSVSMSEGRPAKVTVIKLAGCCLLAGVVAAALMFPLAGGLGLASNRASDIVANGSAQLLEGDVPQVTTMVAVTTTAAPTAAITLGPSFFIQSDHVRFA